MYLDNNHINCTESIGSNFVYFFACIITKTKDRSAVHIILTHLNGELSTAMSTLCLPSISSEKSFLIVCRFGSCIVILPVAVCMLHVEYILYILLSSHQTLQLSRGCISVFNAECNLRHSNIKPIQKNAILYMCT